MSFHGTDQAYRLFQSRDFGRPSCTASRLLDPAKSAKIPGFLVQRESALRACLASMAALFARPKLPASKNLRYLYRDASLTGFQAPGFGIANSVFLHCALILGILFLPMALPTKRPRLKCRVPSAGSDFLPCAATPSPPAVCRASRRRGPGGRPGSGIRPKVTPGPGKTVSNG